MISELDICIYCKGDIDTDEPGWGQDDLGGIWHSECFQLGEDVVVPA